jgi:hypothetical protein
MPRGKGTTTLTHSLTHSLTLVSSAEFLGELQKKIRIAYLLPFSKKQFGKSFGNGGQAFRTKGCVTLWALPFTLKKVY